VLVELRQGCSHAEAEEGRGLRKGEELIDEELIDEELMDEELPNLLARQNMGAWRIQR
jgi:hypothetical protein